MLLIRTAMLSFVKEQLYAALSTEYRIKLTVQLLETASADVSLLLLHDVPADALIRLERMLCSELALVVSQPM